MKKILHIITSLRLGGAEKLMVDLLPLFKEKGLQVDLLLFDGIETPFKQTLQEKGINVYELGFNRHAFHPINLIKLIPYIKKYDIIHSHNSAPQLFSAIANIFFNKTLITTEHSTNNRRRKKMFLLIEKWKYAQYKKVISISEKVKEELEKYLGKSSKNNLIIFNGINLTSYINAKPSLDIEKIDKEIIKIFMIGGFRIQKDQDTIIKSLSLLPDYFHLFLVGDGKRRKILEDLVTSLNLQKRVHFLGVRTDIPSLLKSADIGVMSSHWEGFGLAIVEAMAAGIPVLASNVPGLAEVVGEAGILFEKGNEKELAEKIFRLHSIPKMKNFFIQKSIQRAKQFDINKMINGYINCYNNLN